MYGMSTYTPNSDDTIFGGENNPKGLTILSPTIKYVILYVK